MKLVKFFLLCMVSTLLIGCTGVNSTPYKNDPVETKVILKESNYKIVKEVEGEWSATYVFGISGLKKKVLTSNAIAEMYKNAALTGNQQINITTTQSVESWAGIYSRYKVIARGYVIEFK